jgi:hypothetical protein
VIVRAEFLRAGTIEKIKSKGRLVVRGAHRPILVVEDQGRIFALDNRCPHAVLHGALAIYLIRYLNVPPARLPALGDDRLESMPSTIEEIRSALLDAFDRQHQIDAAANLVARHLTLGHPPDLIISALAHALLREDAGFHAFQMFDAGVRQFGEWGNTEPGRHILVAVARYLAAHSPTERGWLQTADIAARLSRGDQLHADEPPAPS